MLKKPASYTTSRPKHRTQKYNRRDPKSHTSQSNTSQSNPQNGTVSNKQKSSSSTSSSNSFSTPSKPSKLILHHHQHTHNHYVHHTNSTNNSNHLNGHSTSQQASCCEFKKCLIYALLVIVAYYLLFLAISSTYKRHKDSYQDPSMTISFEGKPSISVSSQDNKVIHSLIQDANTGNDQKAEFRRRKQERRAKRIKRLEALKERRARNRENWSKLEPFPKLYISDAPYFLDKNIAIIGQLSNADTHLKKILSQLESVACLFNSSTFIFFESNSKDNTSLYLEEFGSSQNVNCTEMKYNPLHTQSWGQVHTLDDLMILYDNDIVNGTYIDDILYGLINNVTNLDDLNIYDMSWYLTEQIQLHQRNNNDKDKKKLSSIEIEEILYEKLKAIKYVKYRNKIRNHGSYLSKYIITGDEYVAAELEVEREILKQMRIYDGVNEFHLDDSEDEDAAYNELERIRWSEGNSLKLEDFESQFSAIHDQIEGEIADEEEIIHQKLRYMI